MLSIYNLFIINEVTSDQSSQMWTINMVAPPTQQTFGSNIAKASMASSRQKEKAKRLAHILKTRTDRPAE